MILILIWSFSQHLWMSVSHLTPNVTLNLCSVRSLALTALSRSDADFSSVSPHTLPKPGCSAPYGTSCLIQNRPALLNQSWQFHGLDPKRRLILKDEFWSGMHQHLHSARRGVPGTAAARLPPSLRSCEQPHSVRRGSSRIYLKCIVFQLVSSFLLWNWSTSICHFYQLFDLSRVQSFSRSGRFCDVQLCSEGTAVKMILLMQTWLPSYRESPGAAGS